jgi:hypothetical protein
MKELYQLRTLLSQFVFELRAVGDGTGVKLTTIRRKMLHDLHDNASHAVVVKVMHDMENSGHFE